MNYNEINPVIFTSFFFMLACSGVAAAADNSEQKLIKTEVHVHRDLIAENSPYRLYVRTGIWQLGGVLYQPEFPDIVNLEGYQKGKNLKLSSFDAEIGLEAPPQYLIEGRIDSSKNSIDATIIYTVSGKKKTLRFIPEIPVTDRPSFNLKFFGREDKEWHRDIIERIEITDATKDNNFVQTLTGFSASSYSVSYEDINYDGYFDIILSTPDVTKKEYIYWIFNSSKKSFERNAELEEIKGHPSRYPWKKQINFGSGKLYEVRSEEFVKIPCCYD